MGRLLLHLHDCHKMEWSEVMRCLVMEMTLSRQPFDYLSAEVQRELEPFCQKPADVWMMSRYPAGFTASRRTCEAAVDVPALAGEGSNVLDRKSTRLNSSHGYISYAVFCL